MRKTSLDLSYNFLFCLFSVLLLGAGLSRYIETDSGNILIHDIDLENYEGFVYKGRLFRPIQASSMNNRPGILMTFGRVSDRYTGDHIAMEFARRGFVVLSIEDFSQGLTDPEPENDTENLIDAGYTFLSTRTFTDHGRLGFIAFYSSSEKVISANNFDKFTAGVFVTPPGSVYDHIPADNLIFTADHETDLKYRPLMTDMPQVKYYSSSHLGMIFHTSVIADLLEYLQKNLEIPNDTPFWFDSSSQRAQSLLLLRLFLLLLLITIVSGTSVVITRRSRTYSFVILPGILIPLFLLLTIDEFFNNFLISVRIGSPFNYLPRISQIIRNFSFGECITVLLLSFIGSFTIKTQKKWLVSDLFASVGFLLCLCGFLPVLFTEKSGWEYLGLVNCHFGIVLYAVFSIFNSFLLRLSGNNIISRRCSAVVNGLSFYIISSNIPLDFLFRG